MLTFKSFCLATFLLLLSLLQLSSVLCIKNSPIDSPWHRGVTRDNSLLFKEIMAAFSKKTKNAKLVLIECFPMQFEGMKNVNLILQRRLSICIHFLYSLLAWKSVSVHLISIRCGVLMLDFVVSISSVLCEHSPCSFYMFIDNHISCQKTEVFDCQKHARRIVYSWGLGLRCLMFWHLGISRKLVTTS